MAVGATYLGFLAQLPPEVVLGSFTGAIIYLLGATHKPKWMWMLLFTVAFMAGLLGGPTISSVVSAGLKLVGIQLVLVPPGMGAMISAACVVNVLIWVRDNPSYFFRKKQEDKA